MRCERHSLRRLLPVLLGLALLGACGAGYLRALAAEPVVAPTDLWVDAPTTTDLGLHWTDNSADETGFEIEHCGDDGVFRRIATVPANHTGYVDADLPTDRNRVHSYRVRAVGTASASAYTDQVSGSTINAEAADIVLSPDPVAGGATATGTVILDSPASPAGVFVQLYSYNAGVASVPQHIHVWPGANVVTFSVVTAPVQQATTVEITVACSPNNIAHVNLNVLPPGSATTLASLQLDPAVLDGGDSGTGIVTLDRPAPPGGTSVALASFSTNAVTVPATVQVAAGTTQATFAVTTHPLTRQFAIRLTATAGAQTAAAVLILLPTPPVQVSSVELSTGVVGRVAGGGPATGLIELDGMAPTGGLVLRLSSDHPEVVEMPASVTVPAGAHSGTFPIATRSVTVTTRVVISVVGEQGGGISRATLEVMPVASGPPIAPSNLGKIGYGPTHVQLGWTDNSANETWFDLEMKKDAGGFNRIAVIPAAAGSGSFVRSGVISLDPTVEAVYTFRVRAANAVGGSDYTNTVSGTPSELMPATAAWVTLGPNPVTGGDPVTGTITLNGVAPPAGAVVTLSSDDAETITLPDSVTVAAGTHAATFPVTTRLVASAVTATVTASFAGDHQIDKLKILPPAPPAPPTILVVTDATPTELALTWIDNSGDEVGFEIERRQDTGDWARIATLAANDTGYRDSGLGSALHYNYRVRAVNVVGSASAWSNEAGGRTLPPDPPAAPSDLTVGGATQAQLTLSWTDHSTNETGFEVERRTVDGAFSRIATVGANVTSITNSDLAAGTHYAYRVRAINTAGASDYSNEAGGTTLSAAMIAFVLSPTLVQGGLPVGGKIILDRAAPAGGMAVALSSDSPSEVPVPASVTVPAGATAVTFTTTTAVVETRRRVKITVASGGAIREGTLTLLPLTPDAGSPESYWIRDLGLPPGGGRTQAWGINGAGQVVGDADGPTRAGAFFFDGTQIHVLGQGTEARGINAAGQIAGHQHTAGRTRAFRYDSTGLHDLGTLPGNTDSTGTAINATGQVVGHSGHAYLYSSGVMQDLGTLGGYHSWATGINDSGQVVGASEVRLGGSGYPHAFLYEGAGMRDLGTLGGEQSFAGGINAAGHIVGSSSLWGPNGSQAFLHDGSDIYNLGGLKADPDFYSGARAINARGQVVGDATPDVPGETFHAFLWQNGRMYDLNDLVPSGSGWVVRRALAINEAGQVACVAQIAGQDLNSQEYALLLTPYSVAPPPVPEAPAALEIAEPSQTEATLSWKDTGATETGFEVERLAAGGDWQQIATLLPNAVGYRDAGLDPHTAYIYRVRAINAGGASSYTSEVSAHTPPATVTSLTLHPDAVQGGESATGTVTLSGPAPAGGAMVTLSSGNAAARVPGSVTVAAGETSVSFAIETGGVRALVTAQLLAAYRGSAGQAALTVRPPAPPAAPSRLAVAVNVARTALSLEWKDNSTGEDGFEIERQTGTTGFRRIATVGPNVISFEDESVADGTPYVYRLRAVRDVGASAYSNLASALFLTQPGPERTPQYLVEDLGSVNPTALNNAGQVVGDYGGYDQWRPFLWANGVRKDLQTFGRTGGAAGINDAGQVVGWWGQDAHAVLWSEGGMQDLGTLGRGYSYALGINNAGQIIGWTNIEQTGPGHVAFLYRDGTMGAVDARFSGDGTALNDAGQVVGWFNGPGGASDHAFLSTDGVLRDLGTLGGQYSRAHAINNLGQVVGFAYIEPTSNLRHACLWTDALTTDLGMLPGFLHSQALGINDGGQVVGIVGTGNVEVEHAFRYSGGKMEDLNDLIGDGSGWVLQHAVAINEAGQIVGTGTHHGEERGYRLTPLSGAATGLPFGLTSIFVYPATLRGGVSTTGMVTLNDPAPAGGTVVTLASDNPAATVPPTVTVGPGATGWVFPVATQPVAMVTTVTVTATSGGEEHAATLTLLPPPSPGAPSDLVVSQPTQRELTLTWTGGGDSATGFEVERKAGSGDWQKIATLPANTTRFQDTGLDTQADYSYRVRAINAGGASSYSNEISAHTLPPALTSLRLEPSIARGGEAVTGTVTLDAPAPPGGALVTLTSENTAAATVPATVAVPAGAAQAAFPLTIRTIPGRVTARITATYGGQTTTAILTLANPPAAPADLVVSAPSQTALILAWSDRGANETGFEIERRTGDTPFRRIATVASNAASYTDTGLLGGSAYTYRVRNISEDGASPYSNEAAASTLPVTVLALEITPAHVVGGASTTATVTLDGPAPAGGAVVSVANDNPAAATVPANVTVPAGATTGTFIVSTQPVTSVTLAHLQARYGIRYGTEGPSATLTITPPDPPAAPTILVVSDATATELALAWIDNGAGETGFAIERKRDVGEWERIGTAPADATSYRDPGLSSSTHYTYRVRAINLGGGSAWSNEAGGTTTGGAPAVGISFNALSLPKSLAFGDQTVGSPSAPKTITLTNTGTAPLAISSVTLKGLPAGEFILVTDSEETTVAPGGKRTFTLRFTPAEVGSRGATLVIADNAPGSPHAVALGGTGIAVAVQGIAVFRPSTCEWFFRGAEERATVIQFGGPEDVPVAADYLGLERPQVAVFRPETREWFIRAEDGSTIPVSFGGPDDVPVPGDYLGLHRAQVALFRPSTQEWFLRRDDGTAEHVQFGGPGDVPVPGDFFGSGRVSIAVYRPGTGEWFLRRDDGSTVPIPWGTVGDVPVAGDYLGLHRAQVAVFRPSTREWFIRQDDGKAVTAQFGGPGDVPAAADYFGLGRLQMGVYRPGEGVWYLRTDAGGTVPVAWGGPEDWPLAMPRGVSR